jgi:hypothetical protein
MGLPKYPESMTPGGVRMRRLATIVLEGQIAYMEQRARKDLVDVLDQVRRQREAGEARVS